MALRRFVIPLLFLLVTGSALGADTGYWTCSKGQWVPVGEPSYNRPLRDCMEKPPLPQSQQRCDALGGTWGPAGLFPKPICRMSARDAGRICGDADECDSTWSMMTLRPRRCASATRASKSSSVRNIGSTSVWSDTS